jgi:hypothetical protein
MRSHTMTAIFHGYSLVGPQSPNVLVSDDGRAFTIIFSDLQVEANNGSKTPRMAAGWKGIVFRLPEDEAPEPITLSVEGYAFTQARSTGTLVIVAGGTSTLVPFGPHTDREFVETVVCTPSDHELRIGVSLIAEGAEEDGAVLMNVTTVNGTLDQVQPAPEDELAAGAVKG